MFHIYVSSYNISPETFNQITQCLKSYQYNYTKHNCFHTKRCSRCGVEGYFFATCTKEMKCCKQPKLSTQANITKSTQTNTQTQEKNTHPDTNNRQHKITGYGTCFTQIPPIILQIKQSPQQHRDHQETFAEVNLYI